MSAHVSIERTPDGRTVACKRATVAAAAPAVRAEAARLAAVEHRGVIRFVDLREGEDGPTLVTEYVGPRTLASLGPVTSDRAASLIADLASTVADLHALGIVHGALRPEHVLVAGDRTVLCGLAADPDGHSPADDVHGIGVALRALLDPDLDEEPIPDRRPWRRVPWQGYRHRALLTLADQATHDDPVRRPAARALAGTIRELVGGAVAADPELVTGTVPSATTKPLQAVTDLVAIRLRHRRRGPAEGGRPWYRIAVLAGFGLIVLAVGVLGVADRPPGPSVAPTVRSSPPTTAMPSPSCPAVDVPLAADLDGDGCPEAVRIGPGWVDVDDRRFRVGRPDDSVRIGDWDGDGVATVALLRPATDEVWLFPHWDPDGAVSARLVARLPEADELLRRLGADHDRLLVRHPDGTTSEIPV